MLLFGADFIHHILANGVAGHAELLPPVGQNLVHLASVGSQAHEIESRPEAGLLSQSKRCAADTLLETWLHHPDLAHVTSQLAPAGDIPDTRTEHIVNCILKRRVAVLTLRKAARPTVAHVSPQNTRQQKAGGYRLAFAHPAIGIFECRIDKGLVGALHHHIQQRINTGGHPEQFELVNRQQRMPGLQQLEHLVKQTALRYVVQKRLALDQRPGGLGFQLEAERAQLGGKAYRADDAHRVLAVAGGSVANHAQGAALGVLEAIVVVHHNLGLRVVVHRIDGEVAAHRILLLRAPDVVPQHAPGAVHRVLHAGQFTAASLLVTGHLLRCSVVQVGPKGRHFNHLMLATAAIDHVHDAKAPADDEGAPEQAFNLLWRCVGGYVKVFGAQAHQKITYRTADDIGLKSCLLEHVADVDGPLVHQGQIDTVH